MRTQGSGISDSKSAVEELVRTSHLRAARANKNDEFYTVWETIQSEINAYVEYDPDVFRDKVILLPCDDPEWSNFARYFALHFTTLGIKKLISTSYAPNSNPAGEYYEPTLFETEDPKFDPEKTWSRGKMFVLEGKDITGDGRIDIDDLQWDYLAGDGDFRSDEVTALRDEADIVITNPPFSLFRAFLGWLVEGEKQFAVIGNNNSATYKEVFPLLRENLLWKGATANNSDMVFGVPKGTDIKPSDRDKAERLGYPSDEKYDYTRLGNSCWFTNIEHGRRHEPLQLMTMADNARFGPKSVKEDGYLRYDNYDAIEVPTVKAIPSDHDGVMGVPIGYLDSHNPNQFEIIGIAKAPMGRPTKIYPKQTQVSAAGVRSQVTKLNDGPVIKVDAPPSGRTYYEVDGEYFVQKYARILIRHRKDNT